MDALGLYNKLPIEIRLMIWQQAIPTYGVHHLRVSLDQPDEADQVLAVAPWIDTEKDASSWRYRFNISQMDKSSWEEYTKWVTKIKQEKASWGFPFHQKEPNDPVRKIRAEVHGAEDLVVFTLTDSKTNLDLLDEKKNKDRFRGLQRIALNWKQTQTGKNWLITPFRCTCPETIHKEYKHCPVQIVKFLRLFPNLKHFYFIFRVTANDIKLPRTVKQGRPIGRAKTDAAQRKTVAIKKSRVAKAKPKIMMSAEQIIKSTLTAVRRAAEKQNLEIWSDSERTYYEADTAQLKRLKGSQKMVGVTTNLKTEWRSANNPLMSHRNKRPPTPQFHFLVCRNRISRK